MEIATIFKIDFSPLEDKTYIMMPLKSHIAPLNGKFIFLQSFEKAKSLKNFSN